MKRKKRANRPRVQFNIRTASVVMGDRRTKRQRTRSQQKVQFRKELAGGE